MDQPEARPDHNGPAHLPEAGSHAPLARPEAPVPANPVCWAVSDGRRGMENQVLGLAEALQRRIPGLQIVVKRVALARPYRWLPYSALGLGLGDPAFALDRASDSFSPPWPDLVIGCGRQTVGISLALRRRSARRTGGRVFTVQTQDPRIPARHFDLVLPPRHDGLTGENVITLIGSPNRLTSERLARDGESFRELFASLPRPLAGVLIGGNSKSHQLGEARMRRIAADLKALAADGVGLAITPSRRTGATNEAILREALQGVDAYIWDGRSENPYFGLLAHADHLLVTVDSTNMLTEAAATGKPVHMLALDGGSPKLDALHRDLVARGIARPFDGRLETWDYPPLAETDRAAGLVAEAFTAHRHSWSAAEQAAHPSLGDGQ